MAKNYAGKAGTVVFVTPAGGCTSGVPLKINDLVVVPLSGATKAGVTVTGRTDGCWTLPADAGLKLGNKVGVLNGGLVASGTEGAVDVGKLTSEVVGGFAEFMVLQ